VSVIWMIFKARLRSLQKQCASEGIPFKTGASLRTL
jgi:hypothetical protein